MKYSDADKAWIYGIFHVHNGRSWFGEDDLQMMARMERLGLFYLNPDYDGFYMCTTPKGKKLLEKRSAAWMQIWLDSQNRSRAKRPAAPAPTTEARQTAK